MYFSKHPVMKEWFESTHFLFTQTRFTFREGAEEVGTVQVKGEEWVQHKATGVLYVEAQCTLKQNEKDVILTAGQNFKRDDAGTYTLFYPNAS